MDGPHESDLQDDAHPQVILEQAKYLLDDERSFGDKLVNDRKIKLSLLTALLVGVSFIKIETIIELVGIVGDRFWISFFVVLLLVIAVVSLILSLYLLVLENDPKFIRKLLRDIQSDLNPEKTDPNDDQALNPKEIFGAALVVLYPEDEFVDQLEEDGFPLIATSIDAYKTAYTRLALANRRVRRRLEFGTISLLCAIFSVIILLGLGVRVAATADTGIEQAESVTKEGANDGKATD